MRPSRISPGGARPVQPSAAPRGLSDPTPRLRRRARAGNVSGLSIPPHSGSTAAAAAAADRYHPNRGTLETQHQQRAQQGASSTQTQAVTGGGNSPDFAAARKSIRGRSASARYLLLSVVLIALGLILRYFWRHLAGLAGAMFILAAARRWTGVAGSAGRAAFAPPLQDSAIVSGKKVTGPRDSSGRGSTTTGSELPASVTPVGAGAAAAEAVAAEGGGVEAFGGCASGLPRYWEDGGPECRFNVRGPNYMSDKKKVGFISRCACSYIMHVQMFRYCTRNAVPVVHGNALSTLLTAYRTMYPAVSICVSWFCDHRTRISQG